MCCQSWKAPGRAEPPQCSLPLSLSLWGLPCLQLVQVFISMRCIVMYFFGSFSVPIKKVTAGDQENHSVTSHKSHFLRKTGERWPPRELLCAVVIPATPWRSQLCYWVHVVVLFSVRNILLTKKNELWGADNCWLHSCRQKVALCVAHDESTLPHLFGVACNLHWGEAKPAAQQWGTAAVSFHLGTATQVAVLAPQPALAKNSLALTHSKRQTRDRHCSPSHFRHWDGSCWK